MAFDEIVSQKKHDSRPTQAIDQACNNISGPPTKSCNPIQVYFFVGSLSDDRR